MEENKNLPQPSQMASDEIRLAGANYYNPVVWQGMGKLAKTMIDAKAFPVGLDTEAKVMVALQAGREVGLSPITAVNSFYIVNGKVAIYGDSAIAVVLRDGHQIDWGKCDAKEANVTITRGDNGKSMSAQFTFDDAVRKQLTKYSDGRPNPFWVKYPENMLKFKAFGSIARFLVADSLRGLSIKEELDGSSIDGELVEEKAPRISAPVNEVKAIETPAKPLEEIDESESLKEFISKPAEEVPNENIKKRTKAELIKDINKLCIDHEKDPKKILSHYKKKSWLELKINELEIIEKNVKNSIEKKPEEAPKSETKQDPTNSELKTYYIPEEEVIAKVDEIINGQKEATEEENNLVNDVTEDAFLGKQHPRYKGIF